MSQTLVINVVHSLSVVQQHSTLKLYKGHSQNKVAQILEYKIEVKT